MLFEPVFIALNDRGVRYLVAGGVAVVLHGYVRLTAGLDLVIDLAEDQATAAIEVLTGLGLKPRLPVDPMGFADASVREEWVRARGLTAFTLHDPDNPLISVDLLADPPGDFEELWARSTGVDLATASVKVIALDDLLAMKRRAGEANAERQRRAWLQSTPVQRLEWLEQAIAFAHATGALPRREAPTGPESRSA